MPLDEIIRAKALGLMKQASTAVVASIDEQGYPRAVPMSNIKVEQMQTMWFSTGVNSEKVKHYRQNSRASICYYSGGDGVSLTGDMEMIDDSAIKEALWLDWFFDHFPGGITDPNYCILKFTAKQAVIWIDRVFEHIFL